VFKVTGSRGDRTVRLRRSRKRLVCLVALTILATVYATVNSIVDQFSNWITPEGVTWLGVIVFIVATVGECYYHACLQQFGEAKAAAWAPVMTGWPGHPRRDDER
jgi:hypothetical protein